MHTIPDIAFARPQRSYRIGPLICSHTHKDGCGGAIYVKERRRAVPIFEVESHISDRCSQDLFGGGGAWGAN